MGNFIKQWFTFTFKKDNITNLLYSCSNNHYIHNWLEERGYTDFENTMSEEDLDNFLTVLNESANMIPDCFDTHFPEEQKINFNKQIVIDNKKHCKEQMSELFESLWDIQDMIEDGTEGILKYNVYYRH